MVVVGTQEQRQKKEKDNTATNWKKTPPGDSRSGPFAATGKKDGAIVTAQLHQLLGWSCGKGPELRTFDREPLLSLRTPFWAWGAWLGRR